VADCSDWLSSIDLLGVLEGRKKFGEARWLILQALRKCPGDLMKGLAENTLKRMEAESPGGDGT